MDLMLSAADLADLTAMQKDAILQALFLSLGIDRVIEPEEATRFNEEVAAIPWGIEPQVVHDMVQAARVRRKLVSSREDAMAWIQEIASRLPSQAVKEKTLGAMGRIAMAQGVNQAERGLLNTVAAAFALPDDRLEQIRAALLSQGADTRA